MEKHHLNLEKEVQLRDFDGMIGHITITTIIMVRYIFLTFQERCHDDPKTIGDLFFACSDEIDDLSLAGALQRLLALALNKVRSSGEFAAVDFIKTSRNLWGNSIVTSRI